MPDLAYSALPVAGQPNNASDVITPLNEIKAYVNGDDWVTDDHLESPNNSAYKSVALGTLSVAGTGVGTYYATNGGLQGPGAGALGLVAMPYLWRYTSGDFAVSSKTTKFRVKLSVAVGNTSPSTVALTAGLYPISVTAGQWTLGTVVTGSTAASSGLTTNNVFGFTSSDFSASALLTDPGQYVIGVVVGSITVPSNIVVAWELQVRNT